MIGLVFGILVFFVGIGICIWLCTEDVPAGGIGALFGGIVLGGLLVFAGCCCSVETGNTGVVTVFGHVEDKTFDAGFHMKAPWESVIEMDNRVQKAQVELACFSSDIQEVNCKYTVNYQINKANAQELYKTIGINYYDTAVSPTIAESVKTIMAHYTAEELIGRRDALASEIEELLHTELDKYNIEVVSTAMEDIDFTDSFTNAVEAKQVAAQNKLKAEIEQAQAIKQAEADASVAKTKAEADANVAKVEAEAAAEVAKIQAAADKEVLQIQADAAEYAGKKDAAVVMQKMASLNGWNVVTPPSGNPFFQRANGGGMVSNEEIAAGIQNLLQYYRFEAWDGALPEVYSGTDNPINLILNPVG